MAKLFVLLNGIHCSKINAFRRVNIYNPSQNRVVLLKIVYEGRLLKLTFENTNK